MRRASNNDIEHPEAYNAAIKAAIHGRANAKRWTAWKAAHPHLAEWADYSEPAMITEDGGVTYINNPRARHRLGQFPTFARKAMNEWGAPSEKATAVLQRIYDERLARAEGREAERAAEAATAQPWTAGRQVIEGTVLSVKEVEGFASPYSRHVPVAHKMLVKRDDGSRIYVSLPSALPVDIRGQRVRFTATVEPKAEEPTFAFGSRPAKAEVLASAATDSEVSA